MNKLDELAIKYGADKWGKHHYTPVYFTLFKDKIDKVKKVVEIGAGEGASLYMWEEFFPNAKIYSGEIEEGRLFKKGRIEVIKCDQHSEEDLFALLKKSGKNIDLFIDDGSHVPGHQVYTCLKVMPLLKKDAIYVIEDVADEGIVGWLDEYACERIRVGKRYDDVLLIVKHR
jgi:hypothetical protein